MVAERRPRALCERFVVRSRFVSAGLRFVVENAAGRVENVRGRSGAACEEDVMLRDEAIDIEDTVWGHDGHDGRDETELDWQAIDRELCDLAKRRGALDGE